MSDPNRELHDWLDQYGLAGICDTLLAEDIDFDVLVELTDSDLRDLGLSLGHRRKLLKAVAACRQEGLAPAEAHQPAAISNARPAAEVDTAERRQLTVMFCDLVGSTALSERLDPEDLREVVLAYQRSCVEAIEASGGHVAKYLGDGLLAYFGYPTAHGDDPIRAVRAALDIIEAINRLNAGQLSASGVILEVRVGIHTGIVVAGEMGAGENREAQAIVGETPNVAARLEGLAEPGGIAIGPLTRKLVGDRFACESMGAKMVKGISVPIEVFAVRAESDASQSRFVAGVDEEAPLVGRDADFASIQAVWKTVQTGAGRTITIIGEAGVGKSRLIQEVARLTRADGAWVAWLAGSPFHAGTPLHPIAACLASCFGLKSSDPPALRREALTQTLAGIASNLCEVETEIAALLKLLREDEALEETTPALAKRRLLESLRALVTGMAAQAPVVLIVEDAHWVDATTMEWLSTLDEETDAIAVMMILTARPDFSNRFSDRDRSHELKLESIDAAAGEVLIKATASGKQFPAEVVHHILEKADGNPLFIEELTRSVLESGVLKEAGDAYHLAGDIGLAIPETVQDLLTARLDKLGSAKEIAQIGAAIGRRFTLRSVTALSSLEREGVALGLLAVANAGLVHARGTLPEVSYLFRHALIRDAAYASMLKRRRESLHARIADHIEETAPEVAETEPEVLARHRSGAGQFEAALVHWRTAAKHALRRAANIEAIGHIRRALACLEMREDDDAKRSELELLGMLGPALLATRGWGAQEPHKVFRRAHELCGEIGDPRQTFAALWGIWLFHSAGGQIEPSMKLVADLFNIAEAEADPELILQAHHAAWGVRCWFGDMDIAIAHVKKGLELYDPDLHKDHAMRFGGHDPGVCARVQGALTLWYRGWPDQALASAEDGLSLAHTIDHPPSVAHALLWHCHVHRQRGDRARTGEAAAALAQLSAELALQYALPAATFACWAAAPETDTQATLENMRGKLARYEAIGMAGGISLQRVMLAEVLIAAGRPEEARRELMTALSSDSGANPKVGISDLHRMLAELSQASDPEESERHYDLAAKVARSQRARSFELRVAISLARWRHAQGRLAEATATLNSLLDWFTEGFGTADLVMAKELKRSLEKTGSERIFL